MHMLSSGFCCGVSHFASCFLVPSSCHSQLPAEAAAFLFLSDQIPHIPPLCPLRSDFSKSVCACVSTITSRLIRPVTTSKMPSVPS